MDIQIWTRLRNTTPLDPGSGLTNAGTAALTARVRT